MAQSKFNKDGKKLLSYAMDGFFYFESDAIEDLLDKALIKFNSQDNWKKETRKYIWSFGPIRQQICDRAKGMFIETDNKDENDEE